MGELIMIIVTSAQNNCNISLDSIIVQTVNVCLFVCYRLPAV